jgi:hypothetical protein
MRWTGRALRGVCANVVPVRGFDAGSLTRRSTARRPRPPRPPSSRPRSAQLAAGGQLTVGALSQKNGPSC